MVMAELDGTSFLTGSNAGFIAELYERYLEDPRAGDESWGRFFAELNDDDAAGLAELRRPSWGQRTRRVVGNGGAVPVAVDGESLRQATSASIRALQLIRSYRVRGHLEADLDP